MNNLTDLIKIMVDDERRREFEASEQLSLGEIIDKCEAILESSKGRDKPPLVCFDFGRMVPTGIDSWRGVYAELALSYDFGDSDRTDIRLDEFLKMIKEAVGKTYMGYKGGDFTMSRGTPVWVDNYGEYTRTAVVGIVDDGNWQTMIITKSLRDNDS